MIKRCETCGSHFSIKDGEEWKKICLSCWKKTKRGEDPVQLKINRLENELWLARRELEHERLKASAVIDKEMVRRLLQLCHPDKHNNSEASQKATHWLMERK